jgi:hypothetical protein
MHGFRKILSEGKNYSPLSVRAMNADVTQAIEEAEFLVKTTR